MDKEVVQMKYKKAILVLFIFIISFTYIIHPIIEDKYLTEVAYAEEEDNPYAEGIIRFHVRANSDGTEDQELKLEVRDQLLDFMVEKFEDSESIDESREIIKENLHNIEAISERVIKENNYDYPVEVYLGMDDFPTRKYGKMVFPQGEYETLLVTIGEGKGQNWWCVMFPPLCFVDVTNSVAVDPDNNFEEYVVDETAPPKLKSKTVELVKNLLDKIEVENPEDIENIEEHEGYEDHEEPSSSKLRLVAFDFVNKLISKN